MQLKPELKPDRQIYSCSKAPAIMHGCAIGGRGGKSWLIFGRRDYDARIVVAGRKFAADLEGRDLLVSIDWEPRFGIGAPYL
jgi:hypothetical protein